MRHIVLPQIKTFKNMEKEIKEKKLPAQIPLLILVYLETPKYIYKKKTRPENTNHKKNQH